MIALRSDDINNEKVLKNIYNALICTKLQKIEFFKNIIVIMELPPIGTYLEFKNILNIINLKCSNKFIKILSSLIKTKHISIKYEDFIKICKVFKNVNVSIFNTTPTKEDREKFLNIISLLPKNIVFDYKLIRFILKDNNKILIRFTCVRPSKVNDLNNLILYIKSFDPDFEKINNYIKAKSLTSI